MTKLRREPSVPPPHVRECAHTCGNPGLENIEGADGNTCRRRRRRSLGEKTHLQPAEPGRARIGRCGVRCCWRYISSLLPRYRLKVKPQENVLCKHSV